MNWNFDIDKAPRGYTVHQKRKVKDSVHVTEVFVKEWVLIAHPTDGKVYPSYWIPPKYTQTGSVLDGDRWSGWSRGVEPVAWAEWPEHPLAKRSAAMDESEA